MSGIAQALFMGYGQGGSLWTPASLFASSPREKGGWWDPSDSTTMYTDDGVTQASVNDAIYRIDDKSGNGNHLKQTTEASRPILRQSGSYYYLEFDGSDDAFSNNLTQSTVGNDFFVGVGGEFTAASASGATYFGFFNNTNNRCAINVRNDGVNNTLLSYLRLSGGTSLSNSVTSSYSYSSPAGMLFVGASSLMTLKTTGGDSSSVDSSTYDATTVNLYHFLGNSAVPGKFYGGFMVARAPTGTEESDAKAWITGICGVSWP